MLRERGTGIWEWKVQIKKPVMGGMDFFWNILHYATANKQNFDLSLTTIWCIFDSPNQETDA